MHQTEREKNAEKNKFKNGNQKLNAAILNEMLSARKQNLM